MNTMIFTEYLETKVGLVEVQASLQGITKICFRHSKEMTELGNQHSQNALTQLAEYFAGQRAKFDLSLDTNGTLFQQKVWQQLLTIPIGETCSYADIANKINNPKAVRAVGAANGKNPIAIIVPCHRVIGSNGSLTGYAWGTQIKADLLTLEQSFRQQHNAV
ncbi:methylated-DNA--[protein]-cysteine S-methyltransferase [Paraglaciecola sp. L3A3]|uniref:methylated-DNA--[protein]-cysteine S-methyltransferase n=1 Tax=Paraglaciecola sp. L3A3 TaxID=2686358 RepID=UPI001E5BEDDF|nr:methylated-DNA--[protein]-cysteine S-methyltransferase [Paraglaciecola sp. L3A3]